VLPSSDLFIVDCFPFSQHTPKNKIKILRILNLC
jgi:hypothetical protein